MPNSGTPRLSRGNVEENSGALKVGVTNGMPPGTRRWRYARERTGSTRNRLRRIAERRSILVQYSGKTLVAESWHHDERSRIRDRRVPDRTDGGHPRGAARAFFQDVHREQDAAKLDDGEDERQEHQAHDRELHGCRSLLIA
jgi:hypothetical protein